MSKAQPADVALPLGADPENVDNWEADNGVVSRLVWSKPALLPDGLSDCDIRVVASQRTDGSIIADDPRDEPLVYVFGSDYRPADARSLAQALINAADLVDMWVAK